MTLMGPAYRVLLPYVGSASSFIQRDIELLRTRHEVTPVRLGGVGEMVAAFGALPAADLVLCWFGSVRFLPLLLGARRLGKAVVIVAGGYDVADLPEIAYGNMRPGLRRLLGRQVFRLADAVACVSASAAVEASRNAEVPRSRIRIIPNAFDADRIGGDLLASGKEPLVLTVAGVDSSTLHRKGLLTVARTSRLLPDTTFVVVGRHEPSARAAMEAVGGPNLVFTGYVTDAELDGLYRRARVYFQPALHEAFGCSVAEAMLYNCIPVVTPRFSLPEVVGPCGLYVEPDDAVGSAATIQQALAGVAEFPETPRARITREFPAARRREQLLTLLDEVAAR